MMVLGAAMIQPNIPTDHQNPVYDENGVDRTLIRWMLSMTVEERLDAFQSYMNSIQMIRDEATFI